MGPVVGELRCLMWSLGLGGGISYWTSPTWYMHAGERCRDAQVSLDLDLGPVHLWLGVEWTRRRPDA
jgi:hypothetical protein